MLDAAEEIFWGLKSYQRYKVRIVNLDRNLNIYKIETDGSDTYFCNLLRAPQKRALSGMGNSVLLFTSGLTTLT